MKALGNAACAGLIATLVLPCFAQTFPVRTIRLIVPVPPAGGADNVVRIVLPKVAESLGQQIIIDNRAGGNATIGAGIAAKAPADGYTWLLLTSQHMMTPNIMKSLPYDVVKDFSAISLMVQAPQLLMVHPSVPAKSVRELIGLAKKNPNKFNYGSSGLGSAAHISAEVLQTMGGISMTHIPYKGTGQAYVDLISGQLDLMFPSVPSGVQYHRLGRLRALGVTSTRRHPAVPDIPTIAEAGLPGYDVQSWYGIVAPAGTPGEIVARINAAFTSSLNAPDTRAALVREGADPAPGTAEEFAKFIKDDFAFKAKVARAAGMKAE